MPIVQDAIRFSGVGQQFQTDNGALTALDQVHLSIAQHEFVAVLGPSGCGKSTLLRLAAGLLQPTEGAVHVHGVPVEEPHEDVGIVFQQATLLPWATVLDNVTFPAKHKRGRVFRADRERAAELIHAVGLTGFEHRLPCELSGGMQQRVGIARALFLNPDILLMDEPFSALDALTRDAMGFELLDLWQASPKTVLFITHSIPEAVLLADRIIVMSARPGRIIEELPVPLARPRDESSLNNGAIQSFMAHPAHAADATRAVGDDALMSGPDSGVAPPARMERLLNLPVVLPLLTFATLLIVWELAARLFAIPSYILPSPSRIVQGFGAVDAARWWQHVAATLRVALTGYAVAILISLPIAVALTKSRLLSRALYPLLVVIQSVPVVAVAPIIIVVLGTDDAPRVVITFMITFFPLVVSMTTGLMATPPELIELSRSLRAPRHREITQIRLPYAVPHIFSGLKISITLAVIGAVVAEFVAADVGIGYFIQFSTSMFKLPQAWAGLVLLVILSLSLFQIVSLIQKQFFPWSLPRERQ